MSSNVDKRVLDYIDKLEELTDGPTLNYNVHVHVHLYLPAMLTKVHRSNVFSCSNMHLCVCIYNQSKECVLNVKPLYPFFL